MASLMLLLIAVICFLSSTRNKKLVELVKKQDEEIKLLTEINSKL